LDDLINTSQDIDYLKCLGIIKLNLDANEVASFFKKLNCDVAVGAFLYSKFYSEVNTYSKRRRNRWRAILTRNYFNNPWTSLSVLAATVIIVFTLLQNILLCPVLPSKLLDQLSNGQNFPLNWIGGIFFNLVYKNNMSPLNM
jgi:hypothetical protein